MLSCHGFGELRPLERGRGSAEGRCRESRAWSKHRARSSVAPPTQDLLGRAMCVRSPNQKYHTRVKRSREEIPISWDGNRPTGEASIRELVESWVEAVRFKNLNWNSFQPLS